MSDHGLTYEELATIELGTTVHYANWPSVPSVPVKLLTPRGLVELPGGRQLDAFPDELSREPRGGLGE